MRHRDDPLPEVLHRDHLGKRTDLDDVERLALAYEHRLVRPGDLSRLDAAFFTMNGAVSLVLMGFLAADVLGGGA